MNNSGDVAEQVLRMSLDGAEFTLKIVGAGAKNIVVLLYTILSQQKKTKGRARLEAIMRSAVRSGIPVKMYGVREGDLKEFSDQAKRYGILYNVIREPKGNPDGMVDVIVRGEDAPKIERITERFKFATVETATIKAEIEKSKADKTPDAPEKATPDKSAEDKLLDELFEKPVQKEQPQPENPTAARTEKSPPSEPTSKPPEKSAKGTSDRERQSVREELREIRAGRKQETDPPKREDPKRNDKAKSTKGAQHKQPQNTRKKSKKSRGR